MKVSTISLLCAIFSTVVGTVRIFSTSTTSTICDRESLFGSEGYIQQLRELSTQLLNVGSGYENMHLYLILPTHFGCHFTELEIVVVSALPYLPEQEYVGLRDDIQYNIDDVLKIKLIVTESLIMLPLAYEPGCMKFIQKHQQTTPK